MEKKIIFIIACCTLLLVVAGLFIIDAAVKEKPGNEYFTQDPKTWLQENPYTQKQGDYYINIKKGTRGLSNTYANKQELYYYGKMLVFFTHGIYKGEEFDSIYVDPSIYDELENQDIGKNSAIDDYTKMRISNQMDPDDGIIDCFILAKIEEKEIVFYIFVDKDWKDQLGYTNIIIGDDFNDPDALQVREFDFSEQENGIYVDRIRTNGGWYRKQSNGGIIIGEAEATMFDGKDMVGRTLIYMQ